jgi:hypothetical protein
MLSSTDPMDQGGMMSLTDPVTKQDEKDAIDAEMWLAVEREAMANLSDWHMEVHMDRKDGKWMYVGEITNGEKRYGGTYETTMEAAWVTAKMLWNDTHAALTKEICDSAGLR